MEGFVNPLPHFTVMFMLELRQRLVRRIFDQMALDMANDDFYSRYWRGGLIDVGGMAERMVMRIYRTQIAEMKHVASFSESVIEHYNRTAKVKLVKPNEAEASSSVRLHTLAGGLARTAGARY